MILLCFIAISSKVSSITYYNETISQGEQSNYFSNEELLDNRKGM